MKSPHTPAPAVRVQIPGVDGTFWWLDPDEESSALAPLDHCDAQGNLLQWDALMSESFAHLFSDGTVRRHRRILCHRDQLIIVTNESSPPQGTTPGDPAAHH